jgi:hypothetical protein
LIDVIASTGVTLKEYFYDADLPGHNPNVRFLTICVPGDDLIGEDLSTHPKSCSSSKLTVNQTAFLLSFCPPNIPPWAPPVLIVQGHNNDDMDIVFELIVVDDDDHVELTR